jgi:hypothetical protein
MLVASLNALNAIKGRAKNGLFHAKPERNNEGVKKNQNLCGSFALSRFA